MVLKLFYGDDKRRVPGDFTDYKALVAKVQDMYGIPQVMPLQLCADADGIKGRRAAVQVCNQNDWAKVLSANAAAESDKPIRVWISTESPNDKGSTSSGPRFAPAPDGDIDTANAKPATTQDQRLKAAEREIRQLKKQLARRDVVLAKEAFASAVEARDGARAGVKEARERLQEAKAVLASKRDKVQAARKSLRQTRTDLKDSREEAAAAGIPASDASSSDEASGCSSGEEETIATSEAYVIVPSVMESARSEAATATATSGAELPHQGQPSSAPPSVDESDAKKKKPKKKALGKRATTAEAQRPALEKAANEPPMSIGHIIVLRSTASGKTLRILRSGKVNGLGGTGALARFHVAARVGDRVQLHLAQNEERYLGISEDYNLCATDKEDACSWFRLVERDDGLCHLRCDVLNKPAGIGINKDGSPKRGDTVGTGPFSQFKIELLGVRNE